MGVRFEGRVYQLAGKRLDLAALKLAPLPQLDMVKPAQIADARRPAGLDISA